MEGETWQGKLSSYRGRKWKCPFCCVSVSVFVILVQEDSLKWAPFLYIVLSKFDTARQDGQRAQKWREAQGRVSQIVRREDWFQDRTAQKWTRLFSHRGSITFKKHKTKNNYWWLIPIRHVIISIETKKRKKKTEPLNLNSLSNVYYLVLLTWYVLAKHTSRVAQSFEGESRPRASGRRSLIRAGMYHCYL